MAAKREQGVTVAPAAVEVLGAVAVRVPSVLLVTLVLDFGKYPQRDSNPRRRLEREAVWTSEDFNGQAQLTITIRVSPSMAFLDS